MIVKAIVCERWYGRCERWVLRPVCVYGDTPGVFEQLVLRPLCVNSDTPGVCKQRATQLLCVNSDRAALFEQSMIRPLRVSSDRAIVRARGQTDVGQTKPAFLLAMLPSISLDCVVASSWCCACSSAFCGRLAADFAKLRGDFATDFRKKRIAEGREQGVCWSCGKKWAVGIMWWRRTSPPMWLTPVSATSQTLRSSTSSSRILLTLLLRFLCFVLVSFMVMRFPSLAAQSCPVSLPDPSFCVTF